MTARTHDHELTISQNKMVLPANGVSSSTSTTWIGATFTTSNTFVPKLIRMKCGRNVLPGLVTISIRAVDGSSLPTGSDLCAATIDGDALPVFTQAAWKYIYLSGTTLNKDTTYALIARGTHATNTFVWQSLSTAGSGVERTVTSTDSGSTWSVLSATSQFLFEIFDVIDLSLIRDESHRALYSVTENIPQHQEHIEFTQKDWRAGHGQYVFGQPDMYFEGQSIDTTQVGRVLLGPKINEVYASAVSKEGYTTIADIDDAYNPAGSSWAAQTFLTTSAYTIGTVKLYIKRTGMPGTITVSIRATSAGTPTGSDLCSGTYDGNTLSTSYAWVPISMGAGTALSDATTYAIVVRCSGSTLNWGNDTSGTGYSGGGAFYDAFTSGTNWTGEAKDLFFDLTSLASAALDTSPVKFVWSATLGKAFCGTAGKIYSYDGTGWTDEETLTGITDMIEYNGVLYAALGASTLYKYSTDGSTWTATDLTDGYANKFLVAPNPAGTQDVLWKIKTPNELSFTTNGKTVAASGVQWSSPAYIGDTTNNVTNIFLSNDNLLVGKTDGLYHYQSDGGVSPILPGIKNNRSTANFQYVTHWQAGSYFSLQRGMGEITSNDVFTSDASPLARTDDIDKVGDIVGLSADRDWLYVAILEGTVIHIYKGAERRSDQGELRWEWCPWVYIGTNACNTIAVLQHSATDRRLWFGYGTHTGYVVLTENPTADDNYRFAAAGWIRMSYNYGTNPYWDKLYQTIVTETKACSSTKTVTPKYRKNTETTATALTAAITSNGVVSTNLTNDLTCKKIQFELHFATDNATVTPEVLLFIAKGVEKPETFRVHECVYKLGDEPGHRVKTLRSKLRTTRTTTSLIRFADLRFGEETDGTLGTDYVNVIVQPGYPQEVEVLQEKGRPPELGIKVRLQEIN